MNLTDKPYYYNLNILWFKKKKVFSQFGPVRIGPIYLHLLYVSVTIVIDWDASSVF